MERDQHGVDEEVDEQGKSIIGGTSYSAIDDEEIKGLESRIQKTRNLIT